MVLPFFSRLYDDNEALSQLYEVYLDLNLDNSLETDFRGSITNFTGLPSAEKQRFAQETHNHMANYTFYRKETQLMSVANIASACLIVVGVVSNAVALEVLNCAALERTSFRIYTQWVCWYHLVSLLLTIIRQHTFLLDFEDRETKAAHNRFYGCAGLLWMNIETDHCTTASLLLLVWNRIWAQRNLDKTDSEVSAMRNPILLNVSALLVAMIPTSSYIQAYLGDAQQNNMTMCSFSFIHTYGSPTLQMPYIYRVVAVGEACMFISLTILIVEIVRRAIRVKRGQQNHTFTMPRRPSIEPYADFSESGIDGNVMPSTIYKVRVKTGRRTPSSHGTSVSPRYSYTEDDLWDRGMSSMTVIYLVIYFSMGTPIRILPYFIRFQFNDFPIIMMLSLLRQAFQAGTLLFLYLSSNLVRMTVTELTAQLTTVQYASNSSLFTPNSGKKSSLLRSSRWFDASSKSTAWSDSTSTNVEYKMPSMSKSMRATFAAEKAYESRPAYQSPPTSTLRFDRIEMGLNKNEVTKRQTIALTKRSQTHTTPHKGESLPGWHSFSVPYTTETNCNGSSVCECLPQAGRQAEETERSQRQINVIQGPTSVLTYVKATFLTRLVFDSGRMCLYLHHDGFLDKEENSVMDAISEQVVSARQPVSQPTTYQLTNQVPLMRPVVSLQLLTCHMRIVLM
ncbi:hypothetical protein RRG08_055421 [Elysia crispata]|uniref:Uncharacterized protein n=1 Tax=Elysia crispata TaxID=231223 RepID=A0AAE1AQL9_9GAST|nr:hypothetical protein RRG08_055421 [Elysia crispata]